MTFTFFFIAYPHGYETDVISDLEHYIDVSQGYIIGLETSKTAHRDISGEHYHFAVQDMTDSQYDAYRKTILVKKYQLRGQASTAGSRQYGRIKKVRSEFRFLAYTLKDNNYRLRGIYLHNLQEYIEAAFPRNDKFDFVLDLHSHLQERQHRYIGYADGCLEDKICSRIDFYKLENMILDYHMEHPYNKKNDKTLLLNKLRFYVLQYLQKYHKLYASCIFQYLHNPQIL